MSIFSSSNVTDKIVAPASESNNVSAKLKQEFHSTYNSTLDRQDKNASDKKENRQTFGKTTDKNCDSTENNPPDIFILLENYRFGDFLQLALGEDQSKLNMVIKKNRKLRGVSRFLPVSSEQKSSDTFTNRIETQYLNANWLMTAKPGQKYNAIW